MLQLFLKSRYPFQLYLSIQRVLEGRVPKMWGILNITHNQYLELSMKLDLRNNGPRARDWTEFAEWTGTKFCFNMIISCMFELTKIPTMISDSDISLSQIYKFLKCIFHLIIMKWFYKIIFFLIWSQFCYVYKETWELYFFSFFVISNRNQKDLGNRINPAFLLHKENCHHGCGVLPLVFPGSTQEVRACV